MKIKTILLALFLICAVSTSFAGDGGGNKPSKGNRSLNVWPISVTVIEGISIESTFKPNIGIVTVSVADQEGVEVYNKAVDTSNNTGLSINITQLAPGMYTITYTDANGGRILLKNFTVN